MLGFLYNCFLYDSHFNIFSKFKKNYEIIAVQIIKSHDLQSQ